MVVTIDDVKQVVADVLQLGDRVQMLTAESGLLGSIPEFDSMAVVSVLTTLEENFGFAIDDDEVSAEIFETIGALHEFVNQKVAG